MKKRSFGVIQLSSRSQSSCRGTTCGAATGGGGSAQGTTSSPGRLGKARVGMQPASSSLDAQWPDLVAVVSAAIDLEATARASGALVRRRAIRSAEMLLRLALAYGPGGPSPRAAAA